MDEVKEMAAKETSLPNKSRLQYETAYEDYRRWRSQKNLSTTNEEGVFTYFSTELGNYKSSSLWTKYSMLRSTINLNEGIDISKFPSLLPYLKSKGEGSRAKKCCSLSKENVDDFLMRASNKEHLLNKVILIFGVAGRCGRQELVNLETSCIEDHSNHFLVKIADAKIKTDRSFIIAPGNLEELNLLEIVRRYAALRPPKTSHRRFFVNYLKEKCTVQPVGTHKIARVPSIVAKFLNLENPSAYTSHCFRRTPAGILTNAGISMKGIK